MGSQMMIRALLLFLSVLVANDAMAACTRHTLSSPASIPTRSLWICDTAAEMPSSGLAAGDLVIAINTRAMRIATDSTTLLVPEVGAIGGSPAWGDVTGKPATFPPTIGTGAAEAVAGNDSRLTNARTPSAHAATHVTGGGDAIASAVAAGVAGLMTGSDKTKLDGIAAGAEVNVNADWNAGSGDAQILNKPATYSPSAHAHPISDVTNLQASLDGKSATGHTHAGIPTLLRVAANVANSTTAFADVTGLTMPVTSGVTYRFECPASYTTAASTTALQLAINGPAMTALDYDVVTYTTATAVHAASQTALDTNTNPATGGGATRLPARISGSFIPSANGTFAVRARSEVNASAVTVMRGSWCVVY